MSAHTHILAVIEVDTYQEDENIVEYVKRKLINAPQIRL